MKLKVGSTSVLEWAKFGPNINHSEVTSAKFKQKKNNKTIT